jgi:hypothetical protein
VVAHRLGRNRRDRFAVALQALHQVVVPCGLAVEDQPLKVFPEGRVGEGHVAHLAALGEDRQPPALVVEVVEADLPERAIAEAVVEQQTQRSLSLRSGFSAMMRRR